MEEKSQHEHPEIAHSEPKKPQTNTLLLIIILFLLLIIVGFGAYFLGTQNTQDPHPTPTQTTTPAISVTAIPSLTDTGIPIGEKTVSFTKANSTIYLRYKGKIYSEEAAHKNDPSLTNLPNPNQYEWYGLVDAPQIPDDLAGFDELFDFQILPNKNNFVFIMRWPVDTIKTEYKMYLYDMNADTKTSLLYTSTQGQNGNDYTVPRFKQISTDGQYIALNMFGCWNCGGHAPETMLFNITTKATKKIGKVSYFMWKDNGKYEYKEYKVIPCAIDGPGECSQDPATLQLLTGSF